MNVDVFVFPLIHILLQNTPVPFENSSFLAILWLQMPLFDPYGMCAGRGLFRAYRDKLPRFSESHQKDHPNEICL